MLDKGPMIDWLDNDRNVAEAPYDALDWIAIIRRLGPGIRVVFISDGHGRSRVPEADQLPWDVGSGPYETRPIDRSGDVRAALLAAGKPIVE